MSQPSPFYKNDKERQELIQKRDTFTFSEPVALPKVVVLIAGREGSGKTHLACTMNELGPVYLLDTEYRAQIVTTKFQNVKFALTRNFVDMIVAVKHILKHQQPGTIVIDSGSDLQTFAEIEYLERSEKEKVGMPWNWSEVWRLCNAIIDDVKFSQGFHLVVTARVKEEYVNEHATGQLVPRIYSTLPYKADIVLQYGIDKERKIQVMKNGFTGENGGLIGKEKTLPQIIKHLSEIRPAVPVAVPKVNPQLRKVS
jgi:hypothetical protein